MLSNRILTVRPLQSFDQYALQRLFASSEYTYYRFTPEEIERLLTHCSGVAAFSGAQLQSCLLGNLIVTPCAWIAGFGVSNADGHHYASHFDLLFPAFCQELRSRGVERVYYSGNDVDFDWLKNMLLARRFHFTTTLRSYDKVDLHIPTDGNQEVIVRPYTDADLDALQEIEAACFAPYWRYDAAGFREIRATYPYFVVAERAGKVIGYQFNTVEAKVGYLVRIAVHPNYHSQAIGARLMAEAIRFFARQNVWKIALNTEESNHHAHRLYEWFGFALVHPRGFVLERAI